MGHYVNNICYNNGSGPADAYNDFNYQNESTKIVHDPRISINSMNIPTELSLQSTALVFILNAG